MAERCHMEGGLYGMLARSIYSHEIMCTAVFSPQFIMAVGCRTTTWKEMFAAFLRELILLWAIKLLYYKQYSYWSGRFNEEYVMARKKLGLASKKLQKKSKYQKSSEPSNPFEIHLNKRKYDIIGRKHKHERGLPGISRSRATKQVKSRI